jgi:hypothetical protein
LAKQNNQEQPRANIAEDVKTLSGAGSTQQLFREMAGFSNFVISFTIISILAGAILFYGYELKFAGPIINPLCFASLFL